MNAVSSIARDYLSMSHTQATTIVFCDSSGIRSDHPDAELLALCVQLRDLQAEWQRLWHFTTDDWGLDAPPVTAADREWLAYNDNVWPGIHISGKSPRHPDDLPGRLLDFRPVTAEGCRAKAAAVLAMEDAAGYGGDYRDDSCELHHSVLVDAVGSDRMLLGQDAAPEAQDEEPRRPGLRAEQDGLVRVWRRPDRLQAARGQAA